MVVLPVPISPVTMTNPERFLMPKSRWAKASLCFSLRYKNLGSGVRLNGFSRNP